MEGLSQDVLSFLIDIQERGANQLRALSTDFKTLQTSADQTATRLKALEGQMAKTAGTSTAAGEKLAAAADAQAAGAAGATTATAELTAAQRAQAEGAAGAAAAQDRLTTADRASAAGARNAAAGADAVAASQRNAGAAAGIAATGLRRHSGAVSDHTKRMERLKSTSHEFGHTMNAVSLPLLATGAISIKMGLDFEAAMSRLHTQAGYANKDVKELEASVLKAAPAMRRTPTELANGLYHVASVGVPAKDALKVMEAASIGANIGASNLEATTNGLVFVMKNMGQGAGSAKEDMAVLNEIVGAGNLRMEDLVTSLGKVLPQAKVFGLGVRDVGAALDVLTARGMDAHMAATRLAMSFNLLGAPKPAASAALAQIGLSATKMGEDLRKPDGVLVAIRDLSSHLDHAFPRGRKLTVDDEKKALETYKTTLEAAGMSGKSLTTQLEKFANHLTQTKSPLVAQAGILSAAFGGGRQSGAILSLVQNVDDLRKTYGRLPEGAQALHRLMDAQATWEKTSQAQLDAVKASFTTTMTTIGKNLAPVVLPVLKDIASDVEHMTHAFKGLPKPVQHAVEALVGIVAIAGPVAGVVSKFAAASLLMEKMRGGSRPGGILGGGGGAPGAPGGALGQVVRAEYTLTGFRGGGVGSRTNPIVVAMLGQVPGGGSGFQPLGQKSPGEAVKTEGDLARGERGLAPELAAGEQAGAAGLGARLSGAGSSLLSGGKALLGRAMGGGMIALGGVAASELAGSVIGGQAGKDVTKVGNDAAFGAALGSMIAPGLGTAVGAALGAGFAGLKILTHEPSHAERVAQATTGGRGQPHLDDHTRGAVEAIVQHHQEVIDREVKRIEGSRHQLTTSAGQTGLAPLTASQHKAVSTLDQGGRLFQGQQAGAAEAKYVIGGVKYPDVESIIRTTRNKMGELTPIARRGYADMMRAAVEQLEREKRLPAGALAELNKSLANQFGSLSKEAGIYGAQSMKALAASMKTGQVFNAARDQVEGLRKIWSGIPSAANLTSREAGGMFQRAGTRLKEIIATTSGEQKEAAEKAYKELKENAGAFYGSMVVEAEANLKALARTSGPLTQKGTQASEAAYRQMRLTIEAEIRLGIISYQDGMGKLAAIAKRASPKTVAPLEAAFNGLPSVLQAALTAGDEATKTGLKKITDRAKKALHDMMGSNAATNLGGGPQQHTQAPYAPGHSPGNAFGPEAAKGMRIPGPAGPDNVPLYSPRGQVRGIVAGGELLIANRHTEQRVDRLLAPYGTSLGHEVAGERRPHSAPPKHFAKGGSIPGYVNPVPGLQLGRTDQGVDFSGAGPIYAIAKAKMTRVSPQNSGTGWPGAGGSGTGAMIVYEILAGPERGRDVYQAENIDPVAGLRAGQLVQAGQQIARARGKYPFLEIGFSDASGVPLAHGEYSEGKVTAAGKAFLGLLQGAVPGAYLGAAGAPQIQQPKWTGPGGLIGALGRSALAKATAAANRRLGALGSFAGVPGKGGSHAANEALGKRMMIAAGWPATEWPSLQALWTQESGWDANSVNSSSGAYGIPQALGHGHPFNLGDARAQIAWGLNYIRGRYGSPSAAEGHERQFNWYERGGRAPEYAGKFSGGGVVTADKPTMAMFGEGGRETAIFVPHAETGAQLLAEIGVTPAGPKGEKPTEGLNPDNNQIEVHTPAEWRSIRARHSQYVHAHPKARTHKAKAPTYEREVEVGGLAAGEILDHTRGAIDLPKDLGKLSAQTWKKVVAAIEATLKQTGQGSTLATAITGELSRMPGKRAHEAALKAIETTSKTVMTVFSKSPRNEEGGATQAIANLEKLVGDAKREHAKTLVAALRKNIETVLTQAGEAIMKTVGGPKGESARTDTQAIMRLGALIDRARARGSREVELTLRKDIEKVVQTWSGAISTRLQTREQIAQRGQQYRQAQTVLRTYRAPPSRTGGPGVNVPARPAGDPAFVAQQQAAIGRAIGEYRNEEAAIHKLIAHEHGLLKHAQAQLRKLTKKLHAAVKHHHAKVAKQIRGEIAALNASIAAIDAVIGEAGEQLENVASSIQEAMTNEAELAAEQLKAAYESFVENVTATKEQLEAGATHAANAEKLTEGKLHREGLDFSGLEQKKSEQEGALTPDQIAQAQADLATFTRGHQEQISADEATKAYEQSVVGGLSGADRTGMEQSIEGLALAINDLQNGIYDQTNATKKLTEATNTATKTFGGSVGFSYQGQDYVVGSQSSVSGADIMVGT